MKLDSSYEDLIKTKGFVLLQFMAFRLDFKIQFCFTRLYMEKHNEICHEYIQYLYETYLTDRPDRQTCANTEAIDFQYVSYFVVIVRYLVLVQPWDIEFNQI